MKPYCFAKNRIVSSQEAQIHPMDISLIRGYGIFDFLRTSNSTPLFLEDYLDRFIRSARRTRLPLPFNKAELSEIIHELVQKNGLENGGIRMMLSGGVSEDHFSPANGQLFIFCETLLFPIREKYEQGIKIITAPYIRPIADVKTTNYALPVWLSEQWNQEGGDDVLYHAGGLVSECSRSNIFIVKDGKVATPKQDILEGITRKRVLELIGDAEIRPISLEEVFGADEVFMTSTTKRILPITEIDEQRIGDGQVGSVTRQLMQDFMAMEKALTGLISS